MKTYHILVYLWGIHMIFLSYLRFKIIKREAKFDIKQKKVTKSVSIKALIRDYKSNRIHDMDLMNLVRLYYYSRLIFYILTPIVFLVLMLNPLLQN